MTPGQVPTSTSLWTAITVPGFALPARFSRWGPSPEREQVAWRCAFFSGRSDTQGQDCLNDYLIVLDSGLSVVR